METALGAYLQALRTTRNLSLRGLAERAQLAKGTLSYWESGRYQPRLPELEAALEALGASKEERARALSLVEAPRAERLRREEAGVVHLAEDLGPMPSVGELMRALRLRQRMTPEQAAAAL